MEFIFYLFYSVSIALWYFMGKIIIWTLVYFIFSSDFKFPVFQTCLSIYFFIFFYFFGPPNVAVTIVEFFYNFFP